MLENLKVKKVIISKQKEKSENYEEFKNIVNENGIKLLIVNKGDKIEIEKDLCFEILWPDNEKLILENPLNNNSIVCKLKFKNFSMLFTGDIEKEAEEEILKEYKESLNFLNTTILKVAHHGSTTSSSMAFLEAVKPKIALIGVGKNNKFGHPNDETLKNLQSIRMQNL